MSPRPSRPAWKWTAAALAMVAVLLAPALWNGFPFVFADTGGYLARPFERTLELGRSAFYGAFLAAGMPLDFWPNVGLQAILTAWVLLLTLRAHGLGGRPGLPVVLVIALAPLTGLPWYVGQLIPDILSPLAVLALHLLAFRAPALRPAETALLIVVIAAAIASHMVNIALLAVLLAAFAVIRALAPLLRTPRARLGVPALAVAAGLLLAPLSNLVVAGRFAFTPGGTTFVFGRLLQDGIVARYLADRCPDPTLKLCAVRDALPSGGDDWLWGPDSALHRLGGWAAFEPEAGRIVRESLRLYPGQHLAAALTAAATQFVTLKTGDGIRSQDNHHALAVFRRLAPSVVDRFAASRQQQDWFDFTILNAIQVPLALACIAVLALLVLAPRDHVPRSTAALAVTTLVVLIANAAICGVFSNPSDRYQNRLAWLAPFAVMVAALHLSQSRRRRLAAAPLP
jgi:hypothetical protein